MQSFKRTMRFEDFLRDTDIPSTEELAYRASWPKIADDPKDRIDPDELVQIEVANGLFSACVLRPEGLMKLVDEEPADEWVQERWI